MKDGIEILHEGLTLLLSFILDPPEDRDGISEQILSALGKFSSLSYSTNYGEMGGCELFKAKLSDFLLEIDTFKVKIRNLYVVTPYSSQFISFKADVLGFFDSMMENLKNILEGNVTLIPSIKNVREQLWIDFVSLRPLLIFIPQVMKGDENKELQDLWREIVEMVYNADYFIKLSHVRCFYAWYCILGFGYVTEHLRSIKAGINKLVDVDKMHFNKMQEAEALRPRGTTSEVKRVSMGFVEDQQFILDELTSRGKSALTVISITGSGGQGKTTFAKRIYNHPRLQCYFQKFVWCYVSEKCPVKEVLVQALYVGAESDDAKKLEMHDLRVQLWRSLRKRRYLVVLDDIWDEDAWYKLESLFPDDNNGSRILLTTRNHDLASKFIPNSISHRLPLFSDEESWKLIKNETFGSGNCDEALIGVGTKIASYCKGLPLAAVLIAGLLGRTEQNLDLWNQVADNLKTHLADEGCGKVIELSYNYLPDHLKPCFQYFGVFERGREVNAKELMLLWIGEGFVSEEDMATKYLNTLVSQGLVVVADMSSIGGIKTCKVHDLLYDMCLEKCKDNNFLDLLDESVFIGEISKLHKFNHHRLRIGENDPFIKSSPIVTKRELPTSPLNSFLWRARGDNYAYIDIRFLASFKILTLLNLNLNLADDDDGEFPEVILSCILLRYLKIHIQYGRILAVPLKIANLWKLEIFIITKRAPIHLETTELPRCVWSMKSLRHVHVERAILDSKDFDGKNLFGGGCSNIETLSSILLDEIDGATSNFLRNFPRLRKFTCRLDKAGNGSILKLLSTVGSQPTQLESLKVDYNGGYGVNLVNDQSIPDPINFSILSKIENVTQLSLSGTEIPWSFMPEIGKQLPNLRVLKLLYLACVGGSWNLGDGGFSKLVYLRLYDLHIREIDDSGCEENPFPCLEHLVLDYCFDLPPIFEEAIALETIKLTHCSFKVEALATKILEVQREYGNDVLRVSFKN